MKHTAKRAKPQPAPVAADPNAHALCVICQGEIVRHPKERPSQWRDRQTCSPRCKHDLLSKAPARLAVHAPCTGCGGQVERRSREQRAVWIERKTCSPECLAGARAGQVGDENTWRGTVRRARAMAYDHPPCMVCRGSVDCRDDEAPAKWRQRLTCSRRCLRRLRGNSLSQSRKRASKRMARPPIIVCAATKPVEAAPVDPTPAAPRYGRTFGQRRVRPAPAGATFETVEQAKERGLVPTRIEFPPPPLGGVPVRSRVNFRRMM